MQIGPNDDGIEFYLTPCLLPSQRWGEKRVEMIGDGKATVSLVHFCDVGFFLELSLFLRSVSKLDAAVS